MEKHSVMGGRVHVYKRENSRHWQCSTFLAGRNWRVSTKEDSLAKAKDFAEDWFLGLKGKHKAGEIKGGKTFKVAADQFLREYPVITQGLRTEDWVQTLRDKLRLHLLPFFGSTFLADITSGKVQE